MFKIMKFGGTSVGLPSRMQKVARLVTNPEGPVIVVLSAISGTTNTLVKICEFIKAGNAEKIQVEINNLERSYQVFINELYSQKTSLEKGKAVIETHFGLLKTLAQKPWSVDHEKEILAIGEQVSTRFFTHYLEEQEISVKLLDALDFMVIDENHEPVLPAISEKIKPLLEGNSPRIWVTQGFICRNASGKTDNLKRGGSDYTASLIGAAIQSPEVEIWTDIDGLHNNDPRVVQPTYPIAHLNFDEAAELAYFGAKILHPSSILPAQKYSIPVRLKSTINEEAPGTLISNNTDDLAIKAIAAKDNITAIKIKSTRMLMAYGFLRRVFEVFENHKTSIDMITTSEVAVSLTIDDNTHLEKIIHELEEFGTIITDHNQTIICIVGNMIAEKKGVIKQVFNALSDIPVRMVSYGGSRNNISMLLDTQYKAEAMANLNSGLFQKGTEVKA